MHLLVIYCWEHFMTPFGGFSFGQWLFGVSSSLLGQWLFGVSSSLLGQWPFGVSSSLLGQWLFGVSLFLLGQWLFGVSSSKAVSSGSIYFFSLRLLLIAVAHLWIEIDYRL